MPEHTSQLLQQPGVHEQAEPEVTEPVVLHVSTLSRAERERVKRIVTPKSTTGRLEVPDDVFQMWQTPKGKEQLLAMWCKSGGVKDCGCARISYNSLWLKSDAGHVTYIKPYVLIFPCRRSSCSVLRFCLQQPSLRRLKCMVDSIPKLI